MSNEPGEVPIGAASDEAFDQQIGTCISAAMQDMELSMAFTDAERGIETESMVELCRVITEQVPATEADLKARFGKEGDGEDAFLPEAVLGIVQIAWNHGFRAGRVFQARGYEVPGEGSP